jgi:hypothetical protein
VSVDWWAKKLGMPQAQPQATPDTWNTPRHVPPTPSYQQPPPQQYVQPTDAPVVDENGQVHVGDAIIRWRGGDGNKEQGLCPNCNSRNYFSRSKGQGKRIGLMNKNGQACTPAPICFECGYNGMFEAFGGAFTDLGG